MSTLSRVATGLLLCLTTLATAYEQPRPDYIEVEVTFWDEKQQQERTEYGQLWFTDMPRLDSNGRVRGFGGKGHYDGIKWFVPNKPGDVWLAEDPSSDDPNVFILHDYIEESPVTLAFHRLDVIRTETGQAAEVLKDKAREFLKGNNPDDEDTDLKYLTIDGESVAELGDRDLETNRTTERSMTWQKPKAPPPEDTGKPSPVKFATRDPIGVDQISLKDLKKIVFLKANKGLKREKYVGRFVQYSKQAKGDEGRVQVETATWFGGPGKERFDYATFLSDDTILAGGTFLDLDFLDQKYVTVLGEDPPADAYQPYEEVYGRKKNKKRLVTPRQTGVMVHYSDDLKELIEVIRLPWGVGRVWKFITGPDNALYLSGYAGPHFDTFAEQMGLSATIENPEAVKASQTPDKKGRLRPLKDDGFVLKLKPGLKEIDWLIRVKHDIADLYLRPDKKLLIRRKDGLFFADQQGKVSSGPKLDIIGSHMTVCPRTGDMYFGGSFRSATGLEPWVSPYLYKVNATGKIAWTAYAWSGPVVGVQQFRLVSDSSVSLVSVGEGNDLSFVGWSDGGNTVFTTQPYDMRKKVKSSGFCSSTWGATGGFTVRIPNIVQLDADTMEAKGRTQYISYIPTSDLPTLINIYSLQTMPNGDIAICGASWRGFVETQDAWTPSWLSEYRSNPYAQAKSGTFFTIFPANFGPPRMATRTPGVGGGRLAQKGDKLLLYSSAGGQKEHKPPTRFDPGYATHIKDAVQDTCGGGHDAYIMLIDTQGEPTWKGLPEWTWDSPEVLKARKQDERKKKRKEQVRIR